MKQDQFDAFAGGNGRVSARLLYTIVNVLDANTLRVIVKKAIEDHNDALDLIRENIGAEVTPDGKIIGPAVSAAVAADMRWRRDELKYLAAVERRLDVARANDRRTEGGT